MNINVSFDSSVSTAPSTFTAAINYVVKLFDSLFSNPVTVNIDVGYGEVGGQALSGGALGSSSSYLSAYSYFQIANALKANASSSTASSADASLPTSDPTGNGTFEIPTAEAKALGLLGASSSVDGYVGFSSTDPFNYSLSNTAVSGEYDFVAVAEHEIAEIMGRISDLGSSFYTAMDLFRFSSSGTRTFNPSQTSYFSADNGVTNLGNFNTSPSGDYGDWASSVTNDSFDAFSSAGVTNALSANDLTLMDVLGWNTSTGNTPAPVAVNVHANDLNYSSTASGYNDYIDTLNFVASFSDLIKAYGTNRSAAQNWYNTYEPTEKRVETFDGLDYIASYGDLIKAFANAGSMTTVEDAGATHFINNGNAEGRTTTFNGLDYIASYGDLIKAFGTNSDAGAYHFIEYGYNEGRTTTFDGLDYIASYGDLIKAYGANEQAGAAHFIDYGYSEGRKTTFDGLDYIAQYADLMKAFGANNDAGATHYITYGFNEKRSTGFDVAAYEQAHTDLIGKYASNDTFLAAYINTFVTTGNYLT